MLFNIRRLIRNIGFKFGIDLQVRRLTSENELNDFMKLLYPIKTNLKLIRVGSKKDGGYIIVDDLEDIEALFSPGVGNKQDFDLECANNGMKVFMADASVSGPIVHHQNFNFEKKFIGSRNDDEFMSIDQWIKKSKLENNSDLILQMDIEGYEYEVLNSIPLEIMQRFRIVIIEFHELDMLWNKYFFNKFKNSIIKILETHYVIHNHPNNCCLPFNKGNISIPPVLEISFIRKDRVTKLGYMNDFPNSLDVDCTKEQTLVLPKCWYSE